MLDMSELQRLSIFPNNGRRGLAVCDSSAQRIKENCQISCMLRKDLPAWQDAAVILRVGIPV